MAKIKLRYRAMIVIEPEIDESEEGLLPYATLRKAVKENMTTAIKRLLEDEFDEGAVTVIQLYADVWREDEK